MCLAGFFIVASCLAGCQLYSVSHWMSAISRVCLAGCQRYSECVSRDVSVIGCVPVPFNKLAALRLLDVSVIASVSCWISAV